MNSDCTTVNKQNRLCCTIWLGNVEIIAGMALMIVSVLRLSLSHLAEILCNICVLEISFCLLVLKVDMNFAFRMN